MMKDTNEKYKTSSNTGINHPKMSMYVTGSIGHIKNPTPNHKLSQFHIFPNLNVFSKQYLFSSIP